jgi:Ku70/Ku80 beta-barrel domain
LVVRPYWKGYLKLALVSCPIALHAACLTAERIALRQINKATGNRLRQQLIDEETGAPVGPEHKARGYEVGKGEYLVGSDEELDAIEIASTHTIEIDSFVPRSQIDERFFDTPYYITASEPVGQEAFAVIREAMRRKPLLTNAWPSASMSTSMPRRTTTRPGAPGARDIGLGGRGRGCAAGGSTLGHRRDHYPPIRRWGCSHTPSV